MVEGVGLGLVDTTVGGLEDTCRIAVGLDTRGLEDDAMGLVEDEDEGLEVG